MYDTTTREITFPGGGGEIQAWISRPRESGPYPAIVLLHGRNGVTDSFKGVGVRFAEEGIVGLAVNYFAQGNDPSNPDCLASIQAAQETLSALDYIAKDQIVLSGYCKGGGLTYLGLANCRGYAAGVIWHGGLFNADVSEQRPEHPFDAAQRVEVPILIIHGASDTPVPVADVYRLTQRLNELGKRFELKVYYGTDHAFTLPGGANYVAEHADDAFREAVLFVRRTFGLPVGTIGALVRQPVGV